MKRVLLIGVWLPASVASLILSFKLLTAYRETREFQTLISKQAQMQLAKSGYQFYASLPEVLNSFTVSIARGDARPEIIRQFLESHESPLASYAQLIVDASDANQIDFRLITAISMCESNVGKKMPEGSHNAWGYQIYTGQDSGATFINWEEAITVMAEYLATRYYNHGLTSPFDIGPIYAPPSVETDNSWAKCVQRYTEELS